MLLSMSCNSDSGVASGQLHQATASVLAMKPLLMSKDDLDCDGGDQVSESNFDDGHSSSYKSSHLMSGIGSGGGSLGNEATSGDMDSDNEASSDMMDHHNTLSLSHQLSQHQQHHLSHHLNHHLNLTLHPSASIKLEAALLEFNEGLNLISKPNNKSNDNNNNTNNSNSYHNATTSSNDNNNNQTSNIGNIKPESGNNNGNNIISSNSNNNGNSGNISSGGGGGGVGGGGGGGGNNKTPRKLFECDVCNMKFSNGANMRRHKQRHTGVKPYECRVCQKRFFRKDHLAEHFTTHTKTLPYHCPICNRGFQRQIAMRAHFQNEHVGQHDLVKTCPLCSYRAGTMKSLRVHFFNRHGIDLDNPGSGTPSSLLLALEQSQSAHLLPALAAAANNVSNATSGFSDSGDSARSTDNATPPMHFLTPHVEISMADNNIDTNNIIRNNDVGNSNGISSNSISNSTNGNIPDTQNSHTTTTTVTATTSSGLDIHAIVRPLNTNGSPMSPHSADSNSNIPSSSHSSMHGNSDVVQSSRQLLYDNSIKPSISLIPIKQEPTTNDDYSSDSTLSNSKSNSHRSLTSTPMLNEPSQAASTSSALVASNSSGVSNSTESVTPTSSLASMIKVSPLKSLLREDLKRRITARANNRVARNNMSYSAGLTSSSPSPSSATITGICNSSSNTMIVSPEPINTSTTSNGTITSTGADSESLLFGSNKKRNLQCSYCGIEFPDQTLYFLHKGCHSESNPWKCNICSDVCSNVYEFNSHLLSKSHQ